MQYSDEGESTKVTQKSKEIESEEESSSASSSDEEETEVRKHTKKSKHTQTKFATRAKDTTHYESEEKGKTSGKKGISLEPKSATAKASVYPEEYQDKGRKKAVIVDEKVGKSTDSSQETYHKTSSKPGRKEGDRKIVSGKKATAPSLKRNLPSSEMTQTDSGDGESDKSSEDGEQKSSDEEEQTENDDHSPAEEKEEKRTRKSKEMAIPLTTKIIRLQKPKNHDDENHRRIIEKKSSKAAGAPSMETRMNQILVVAGTKRINQRKEKGENTIENQTRAVKMGLQMRRSKQKVMFVPLLKKR